MNKRHSRIPDSAPEHRHRLPAVPFEPPMSGPPVRVGRLPGREPPHGLRLEDTSAGGRRQPNIRLAVLGRRRSTDPSPPGSLRCIACAHRCVLRPSRIGICGVRQNRGGRLTTPWSTARPSVSQPSDREEAVLPLPAGSYAYSVGDPGLQLPLRLLSELADLSAHRRGTCRRAGTSPGDGGRRGVAAGARSIAYTYVEPTVSSSTPWTRWPERRPPACGTSS